MIKKLASHLGEYKRSAIVTPLLSALEAIMDILLPTIMAFIIDQGIEKSDMNAILKYGLLTFLVAAFALLLGVLAGRFAADASTGFAGNLRDAMYESIQHYSFSNIDKFSTAGLVTRMTTDVTNVQNAFQMIERMCVRAPVHLVFALTMAVVIGGPLALVKRFLPLIAEAAGRFRFGSNLRGSAQYRQEICQVLVRRGLLAMEEE